MNIKKGFVPHLIALAVLIIINGVYFYPAFSGQKIEQHDIQFGLANSKELRDYRETTGKEALWTNSIFSGMPTFQINQQYPASIFEKLERVSKFFQPAQIGLVLFLMVGFYFLMISYKIDPWIGILAAIAFGFSAFFIISFDAGHNAKLRAAGYIAPMIMGILLVFRGKRFLGLGFTALFAGMAISANHIQITYYSVLIAVIIAFVELFHAYKEGTLKSYFQNISILLLAAILALGPNTSKLWSTYEYTQETIRGGGTGLNPENKEQGSGLDKEYAMSWSYGIIETFNLIVPNIMGGGVSQNYEGTQTHDQFFRNIKSNLVQQGYSAQTAEDQANRQIASLFYWGKQSMVNGAYYLGATIFFLFVLGCFLIRDRRRTWIIASIILAIFMAWGKNMAWFNDLLFHYLPLYNKFRVPSMTLLIVFFLMPLMSAFALNYFTKNRETEKAFIKKSLLNSIYIVGGLFLFMAIVFPSLLSFEGVNDNRLANNPQLLDLLIEDRKSLARASAFRSFIFAVLMFGALYLYLQKTIKRPILIGALALLIIIDLWSFDKQHLNAKDFVTPNEYTDGFEKTPADKFILQDDGYYRVFNLNNPFNDAITSYYHKSIGGYHGAKLQRYQELYENVLFKEQNLIVNTLQQNPNKIQEVFDQTPVLNMLNGKYIIYNKQAVPITNSKANGSAWWIENIEILNTPRALMDKLATINTKNTALVNVEFASAVQKLQYDRQGEIKIEKYSPNELIYTSSSTTDQFAVFSEIYYRGKQHDWQAYIDGKPVGHIRVNYVLRGMEVPAGKHEIKFIFHPKSYFVGETIALIGSIILVLVIIGSFFMYYKKSLKKN